MEKIISKIPEQAPEIISSAKVWILNEFGPLGLMLAVIIIATILVLALIEVIKRLVVIVAYFVLPVAILVFFAYLYNPDAVQYVLPGALPIFGKILMKRFQDV